MIYLIYKIVQYIYCRQTGLLVMGPEKGKNFQLIKQSLQKNKIPTVMLERNEFSQHIPNVNLTNDNAALVDTTAGVLYAEQALKAVQVTYSAVS